jgi:hypothetical protein
LSTVVFLSIAVKAIHFSSSEKGKLSPFYATSPGVNQPIEQSAIATRISLFHLYPDSRHDL